MISSHSSSPPSPMSTHASIQTATSHDSIDRDSKLQPLMSPEEALSLAERMRYGLQPKTKDRKWRLKTYKDCFKHTHATEWALSNIDSSEKVAIYRLNQLVDMGYVAHVVDPQKRFRVRETKTLYFRMIDDAIDGQDCRDPIRAPEEAEKGVSEFGLYRELVNRKMEAMQLKIERMDNVLEETVQELNAAHGKLEIVHQEVVSLVTQQLSMGAMIVLVFAYNVCILAPALLEMTFMSLHGLLAAAMAILSCKFGMMWLSVWSEVDNRIVPVETIADDESTTECSIIKPKSFERQTTSGALRTLLSNVGSVRTRKSVSREKMIFMRESYSLPEVASWPHHPLFVCVNTPVSPNLKVPSYGLGPCPIGIPFKFTSDLFEGMSLIRIKGSSSDDPTGDEEYFSGKKRIFQSVVQGRFKEEVSVSDVLTGHEFARPLKNLPHPWILKTASNFIGKVAPGAKIVMHTDQPSVEAILAGTSQVIRGDAPGNEPNITCSKMEEDCSVFGSVFTSGKVSISRRKRLFSNPDKCKDYKFDTETIYTFEFYQNLFDASTYSLDLGFAKIGCSKVLNGQPIQWLGKMRDGRYLWSFQIWHEKLMSNCDN